MHGLSSFIKKNNVLAVITFLIVGINHTLASDQYLTVSYGQVKTDFFAENDRQYQPASNSIGYGINVSESLSFDLNYEKSKGSAEWFSHRVLRQSFYETGESESSAYSVGLAWIPKDHGINFSYSSLNYNESSTTYLPFLIETVQSNNDVYLLSYIGRWSSSSFDSNDTLERLLNESGNDWGLSWSIGLQSIDASADIVERLNADNPVTLTIDLNQKSLSAFADLEINYLVLDQSINYSPYLRLGWNWELDNTGEEYILLSRGEQSVSFEQSGSLFNNQIKTPDSGQVELGMKFYWQTGKTSLNSKDGLDWSSDLSYSQSIDTKTDFNVMRISITVYF